MKYRSYVRNKYQTLFLYQILYWSVAYCALTFFKFFDLGELIASGKSDTVQDWGFDIALLISLSAGILQGTILAFTDIAIDKHLKANKSFFTYVTHKTVAYFLVILFVITISVMIRHIVIASSMSGVLEQTFSVLSSRIVAVYIIYAFIMSFAASFLYQIYQNIGPHIFWPMLLGRYYSPVIEDRIFMFLDLKSSTTHAEKLGHILFSNLIQDCFFDLNRSVIGFQAQVYQYVGDEAVLTWRVNKDGNNLAPIDFYFDFVEQLQSRHLYYHKKYGFVPVFKAGVNCGSVTVAEIGVSKRSIAYHGDVLNTAARIQHECNRLNKSLLLSGTYYTLIQNQLEYAINHIDSLQLKGKESQTDVYSVEISSI
ncbi:MAG: adenylate/guanylate cyclase domain-containing protein [Bacteroidetes bacterium]|nr:adenylate/guanylate cyclase domain-containing protein [Bacteroidota bacterium]